MIKKLVASLICIGMFFQCLEAGLLDGLLARKKHQNIAPSVPVLLVHDCPGVVLEVKGKYRLYDPNHHCYLSTRYIGKRKFIQALKEGLRWGEEFPGVHQLLIVPDNDTVTTIVDGIEYQGGIYVYDVEGCISVVNEIDIEDYLQVVLANQECEGLPQEVLAAIAIAARTTAYHYAHSPKSPYWGIQAEAVGYRGYALTKPNSSLAQSIVATRYMIMTTPDNEGRLNPFEANFLAKGNGKNSRITLQEAVEMAQKGSHAAQILQKAFPGSAIILTHEP